MRMKSLRAVFYAVVVLIGVYMIVNFGQGSINPPMLSGIAFVLIGLAGITKR